MSSMKVTLDEIAKAAGVSPGTVSRVLNGKNKENRPAINRRADRIRRIALDMGYRPNAAARSMTSGQFGALAFVTCGDLGFDWYPLPLIHGIHAALEQRGSRLVMSELPAPGLGDRDFAPRLFAESAVDALLINMDTKLSQQVLDAFEQQRMPSVLLNQRRRTRSISPDERQGGRAAVAWLTSLGHKQIGFFKAEDPSREPHFSITERLSGFEERLEDEGLPAGQVHLGDPNYSGRLGNGRIHAQRFLRANPGLTAMVCYSLPDALAVVFAALEMGRRLPDDLHILVFHDTLAYTSTGFQLDTMVVPFRELGTTAVDMAFDMIENPEHPRPDSVVTPYTQLYDSATDNTFDPGVLLD